MKKYYAIKVGNNVKDLIVESWEECQKYVIGYPAIYKSFISKKNAQRYLENITEEDVKYKLEIAEGQRYKRLKRMIQQCFDFEIPENVMRALIYYESNERLNSTIEFSILNNKMSEKDAKKFIDFFIDSIRKLDSKRYLCKYHNEKIVDLKKHLTDKNIEDMKKLNIEIKNDIYTEYEFELLYDQILEYYKDEDMSEEDLKLQKDLSDTGVNIEEYNEILFKLDEINMIYGF